jgi:hypothetical protein
MSGKPLIGPDTTDVPISNTIRTIVKRRGAFQLRPCEDAKGSETGHLRNAPLVRLPT